VTIEHRNAVCCGHLATVWKPLLKRASLAARPTAVEAAIAVRVVAAIRYVTQLYGGKPVTRKGLKTVGEE